LVLRTMGVFDAPSGSAETEGGMERSATSKH